ncbi:OLC1v1025094C1 [Oldenlandia corymbosa var. corymbosa]|uniref:OLC1v1025094C1 n=1 Tax=Oldenlandia corymbosa var. corymbosa TaxID=529605 RepID=A0AAV1C6Y8_OLDCO|nr:OLC1v1025094C1 [Oldenlandia corymbosa var. corymbosa]
MANSSCSHWWHAPFYIATSIALAVIAISTVIHEDPNSTPSSSLQSIKKDLSLNASKALRSQGFNVMATLLQITPELFLSSPESTIFAIQDSTISNLSAHLPPLAMKQLLQYQVSASNLPIQALLKKPQGSCLTTLLRGKYVKITKVDEEKGVIEINNALITHPDMFLGGPFSVHGILGSLSSLNFHDVVDKDSNFIAPSDPNCENFNDTGGFSSPSNNNTEANNQLVQWPKIIQFLNTNGFLPFAIGLQSVLDGIFRDYPDLRSVTIFAPPFFSLVSLPSPLLDRVVRLHILAQRYASMELAFLPENSSLETLQDGENLEIHKSNSSGFLAIDGVEITAPELFVSKDVIIHGISRALGAEKISGTSR